MRIGYPCLGVDLGWKGTTTFRLASYSEQRLREAVTYNLDSLRRTLEFNVANGLLFFRISSDIVPFASHAVNQVAWWEEFAPTLREIGTYALRHGMRLSTHPDQFVLLNSPGEPIFASSVAELVYHTRMMDGMGLDGTHKIQIHVGGVYGDKDASLRRFIDRYPSLPEAVRRRLVIENDDRLYHVDDCRQLFAATGVPILFDWFHHRLNGNGRLPLEALQLAMETWQDGHGLPMLDYSSQAAGERVGKHCASIDLADFREFLNATQDQDFDVMLEIKDKERSALRALAVLHDVRGVSVPG